MLAALPTIVPRHGGQPGQLNLAAEGLDDAQHVLQAHGRFAGFEVDDESHPDAGRERQLGLCKPELPSRGT